MRGLSLALCALVSMLAATPQAPGQSAQPRDEARFRSTVGAQKAINRHFRTAVLPKLQPCWGALRGRGTVEVKYLYADDGNGSWAFRTIPARRSNLPNAQEDAAVACMQKAATGAAFPREKTEKASSYLISWAWPVPMPPDADRQMEKGLGTGGGTGSGCDGRGASPRCVTCSGSPLTCVYVCVGSTECEVQATKPGGFDSICSEGGKCASGGLFGLVGAVMF